MQGIDTNVLVRYLVQDDPKQSKAAVQYIESRCTDETPGFINHIVLCETMWVLKRLYNVSKKDSIRIIEGLLGAPQLFLQDPDIVFQALEEYAENKIDFADCLSGRCNLHNNCISTITFDINAAKSSSYKLLSY
jgi:predicted nucleic-acid-binding protein